MEILFGELHAKLPSIQKDGTQSGAGGHPPAPPRMYQLYQRERERLSSAHGTLVVLHQVDATLVTLVAAEGRLEERINKSDSLFFGVLAGANGDVFLQPVISSVLQKQKSR